MRPESVGIGQVSALRSWKLAALYAAGISLLILGLFYYWFAVADRYVVFLYGHLGATPFDEVTSSRYWMSGLVASGIVMILYLALNWLLGRVAKLRRQLYSPPVWWLIWTFSAIPLTIGILAITMHVNTPVLPLSNAVISLLVALAGLALALIPGSLAAQQPSNLVWLLLDGAGLMPTLLLLHVLELPSRGRISVSLAILIASSSVITGMVWLGIMTASRLRWHRQAGQASMMLVTGLGLSYLIMPLVHYLLFTPSEYRYISASANFFADHAAIQLMVLLVASTMAIGMTRLRHRWLE